MSVHGLLSALWSFLNKCIDINNILDSTWFIAKVCGNDECDECRHGVSSILNLYEIDDVSFKCVGAP